VDLAPDADGDNVHGEWGWASESGQRAMGA
jgi:hypothetical protein